MSPSALEAAPLQSGSLPRQTRWIISKREDLTWFIGSGLIGYLALAMMAAGFPVVALQFVWFFTVDGPHVLATVTRTYCDRAERQRLGWLLWMFIPLSLVGPAAALAGYGSLFLLLAVCWQHFHIVKQHFGFVMLYKAKNKDRDPVDLKLDRWFLLASLGVPLATFLYRTQPEVARWIPVWLGYAAYTAYGVLALAWCGRLAHKLRTSAEMNWPKITLMTAVVPLQWVALLYASQYGPSGILRAGIALGLFHGLQYHRLLWFHNRNRYTHPGAEERHGFAVVLAGSLAKYLAVSLGLNVLLVFLPGVLVRNQVMECAIWGLAFTHYCLDARIWRVRGDKELAAALHL